MRGMLIVIGSGVWSHGSLIKSGVSYSVMETSDSIREEIHLFVFESIVA